MTRNNAWHIARNNMETIGGPINTTSFQTWGLSCPKEEYDRTLGTQIWNIEHEKDRKLNEKKGDRDLEREIKNKGVIFLQEG